ncbi:MAG TPA: glycosyltransferase [Acidimicrobiia bacterium]
MRETACVRPDGTATARPGDSSLHLGMYVHDLNDRGIARVVRQMSAALAEDGVDVAIVCVSEDGEPSQLDSVPVIELGRRGGKLGVVYRFATSMSQQEFDVVMAHGEGPCRDVVLARMISSRKPRLVLLSHIHRGTHGLNMKWLRDALAKWLYPRADVVAGVSPDVVADLIDLVPTWGGKTVVLPNPVQVFPDDQTVPDHPWFADEALHVVVSVGHMNPRKGHDIGLRAFREVHRHDPDARFILLGDADDEAYMEELHGYVAENDLRSAVTLLHEVSDVNPYLAAADVFMHAARSEAFGLVILEAMSAGTPVVATDSPGGGASWILGGSAYGRLVPAGDADALARNVIELLESPDERQRLSRVGLNGAGTSRRSLWSTIT